MGTSQQLSPTSTVRQLREHIEREFAKVIVGQDELRQQCLMALLCRGHALIEGVPGLAKTLSIKTLSRLLQLEFRRVQATSDLMPSDIIGGNILNAKSSQFELHKGPIFTDLMLVDEINRMPPRTQGALLEGMEERKSQSTERVTSCHQRSRYSRHRTRWNSRAPTLFPRRR